MRALLSLSLLLLACTSVSVVVFPTPTPVPTASLVPPTATPVPTPVPLAELDLASLLIVPGDLPAMYTAGQVDPHALGLAEDDPTPLQAISQEIARDGSLIGGEVWLWVFETPEDAQEVYDRLAAPSTETTPGLTTLRRTLPDVGEKVLLFTYTISVPDALFLQGLDIMFVRCVATVRVSMLGAWVDQYGLSTYARRLDERLTTEVCR